MTTTETLLAQVANAIDDDPTQLSSCGSTHDEWVTIYSWRLDLDDTAVTIKITVDVAGSSDTMNGRCILSVPTNRIQVYHGGRLLACGSMRPGFVMISFMAYTQEGVEGLAQAIRVATEIV